MRDPIKFGIKNKHAYMHVYSLEVKHLSFKRSLSEHKFDLFWPDVWYIVNVTLPHLNSSVFIYNIYLHTFPVKYSFKICYMEVQNKKILAFLSA